MAQRLTSGSASGLFPGLPGINPVAAAAAAGLALFNNPAFPGSAAAGVSTSPSFLPPPHHGIPPGIPPSYPPGAPSAAAIHAILASRAHSSPGQSSLEPGSMSPMHAATTPSGSPLSSPLSNHPTSNQLLAIAASSSFALQPTPLPKQSPVSPTLK